MQEAYPTLSASARIPEPEPEPERYCTFCGEAKGISKRLFRGDDVYLICESCVDEAAAALAEARAAKVPA